VSRSKSKIWNSYDRYAWSNPKGTAYAWTCDENAYAWFCGDCNVPVVGITGEMICPVCYKQGLYRLSPVPLSRGVVYLADEKPE